MSTFQDILNGLPTDVSTFVFSEAQRELECVNRDSDLLGKKSFVFIIVLFVILGLLASISVNSHSFVENNLISCLILVVGFSASLYFLGRSLLTRLYYGDSFSPSQILNVDECHYQTKDALIKGFLISWYDSAIKYNLKENEKRGLYINIAAIISIVSLIIFMGSQFFN